MRVFQKNLGKIPGFLWLALGKKNAATEAAAL
jgi:hypothetical protein